MKLFFLPQKYYGCPRIIKWKILAIQTLDKICWNLNMSVPAEAGGGGCVGGELGLPCEKVGDAHCLT